MLKVIIFFLNLSVTTNFKEDNNPTKATVNKRISQSNEEISARKMELYVTKDLDIRIKEIIDIETKRFEKIKNYIEVLSEEGIIFKEIDLNREQYFSFVSVIYYLISFLSGDTLKDFLGDNISDLCKRRKDELVEIFMLNVNDFKKKLSKNGFINKLFNLKFDISKIDKKCLSDPSIDKITEDVLMCYTFTDNNLDFYLIRKNIKLVLYKLKKYLNSYFVL